MSQTVQQPVTVTEHQLAKQMLVFMIRPIFKPSLSSSIASYPTSIFVVRNYTQLQWQLWRLCNLPVLAITSDGASPNRLFYRLCRLPNGSKVPYITKPHTLTETFTSFVIHHILSRRPEAVLVIPMHIQRPDHFR